MAIVYSKTHGWETEPVESGQFFWRVWGSIPTNVTVYPIKVTPLNLNGSYSGSLPSAELYRLYVSGNPGFRLAFSFSAGAEINSSLLPQLFQQENFSNEDYQDYALTLAESAQDELEELILDAIENSGPTLVGTLSSSAIAETVSRRFESSYPLLILNNLRVSFSTLPDLDLYNLARSNYRDTETSLRDAWTKSVEKVNELYFEQEEKLVLLRSFGEILSEEPALLDYLKEVMVNDADPLGVQEFVSQIVQEAEAQSQ